MFVWHFSNNFTLSKRLAPSNTEPPDAEGSATNQLSGTTQPMNSGLALGLFTSDPVDVLKSVGGIC